MRNTEKQKKYKNENKIGNENLMNTNVNVGSVGKFISRKNTSHTQDIIKASPKT